jgi:2-desacetyl-2-hydroxyethyl bacteriochlorophyllide A dehydrogenase
VRKYFFMSGAFEITADETELKDPEAGQVLVENEITMISPGTELAIFTGTHIGFDDPNHWAKYPLRTGYAAVGTVISCGPNVDSVKPGDRIHHTGRHASCDLLDLNEIIYTVLPSQITSNRAVFARFAQICYTAILVAHHRPRNVLVLGAGLIGNFAAQLFSMEGADKVIITDIVDSRLEAARRCGIPWAANPTKTPVKQVIEEVTAGEGVDMVVEATGIPQLVAEALELVARYGEVILLSSTRGKVELDVYTHVHKPAVSITGAHEATFERYPEEPITRSRNEILKEMVDHIESGALIVDPLLTHVVDPGETQEAYEGLNAEKGKYLGVAIDWCSARKGV